MTRLDIPAETIREQLRASDPGISAWVSANAGAGKTHVLAQRVVRLLLAGTEPSRILCLTYTRAAAANMATRVFETLAAWTRADDGELAEWISALGADPDSATLARARRLFAEALETPGGLKIQTIHAFCEAVLHQFPLEANIAGHFELMDRQMEQALLAEARREMITGAADAGENAELGQAFAAVLERGGEFGLGKLLSAIVARREAIARFLRDIGTGEAGRAALLAEFGLGEDETEETILAGFWPDAYFTEAHARAFLASANAAGKVRAAERAEALLAVHAARDAAATLEALGEAFLTGKGEPRSTSGLVPKGVAEHFPEFAEEFVRLAEAVHAANDRRARLRMAASTHAALTLADRLIAIYERLKSGRGLLDFSDLILRTVNLLARANASAWVQYRLDRGIDHILIDEAQDTSPDQWAVVNALAADFFAGEGARGHARRTVFAVGDEKQSIYSFQGAHPESFSVMGRGFEKAVSDARMTFADVRLRHSFRSVEDVLSAVDLTFEHEEVRAGLTRDPQPIDHVAIRRSEPGCVELWPSLRPETVDEPEDWTQSIDHATAPAARLAAQIAATIGGWLADGETIEGRGRRLAPGDILVLVRKRDSFVHALSRELKNRHIPVAGADRLVLADHIAVKDLAAIGRVVLQPDDDLSLAALLKSPIFGLDDDDLFELAAGRGAGTSLLSALLSRAGEHARWAAAAHQLKDWRTQAGYSTPFSFYARILGRDGVRARMTARLGNDAGDIVDEFLNFCLAAEKVGVHGLAALIGLLDAGGPEIKREMDQSRGEVRILTAHAAKGLEAPVVFLVDSGGKPFHGTHLPDLAEFSRGRRPPGFIWRVGSGISNGFLDEITEEFKRKAEEEYRRLLYVGMTRAEDRLIICGYEGKTARSPMTWHAIVARALMASPHCREVAHAATGQTIRVYRTVEAPTAPASSAGEGTTERHRDVPEALRTRLAAAPLLPKPLAPSGVVAEIERTSEAARLPGSPVLDDEAARPEAMLRGTAIHRLLQRLPEIAPARRREVALSYLTRSGAGWSDEAAEVQWREVDAILGDPRWAAIFAEASRAEISIMGTVEVAGRERTVSGMIDRLAVTSEEVLIVDYKTNRPAPARIADVPAGHVAQMALYRQLLRPLYPGRAIRATLLYTHVPRLLEIDDASMDAALAALSRD